MLLLMVLVVGECFAVCNYLHTHTYLLLELSDFMKLDGLGLLPCFFTDRNAEV